MSRQFNIGDLSPPKLFMGVASVLGVLFALMLEPSGNLLLHFIQWQIQTTLAVVVLLAIHNVLFAHTQNFIPNPWFRIILSGILGAVIFSPIALLSDIYLGSENLEKSFWVELIDEMKAIVLPITVAWLAMNLPWLMGYRLQQTSLKPERQFNTIDNKQLFEPNFLSLAKIATAKDIIYIKSELHYLSVVTEDNKQLILLSLKEAISQLKQAGIEGIQCHRGYWVAISSISRIKRSGRQAAFILINDENVPISRANVKKCLDLIGGEDKSNQVLK